MSFFKLLGCVVCLQNQPKKSKNLSKGKKLKESPSNKPLGVCVILVLSIYIKISDEHDSKHYKNNCFLPDLIKLH